MNDKLTKLIAECFSGLNEGTSEKSTIVVSIPKGYEIDNEESNFDENGFSIKFKKKVVKFRGSNASIKGFYINNMSDILSTTGDEGSSEDLNIFHTRKQAESALAMAQISRIMANDKRFGGVITDEEWKGDSKKHVISRWEGKLKVNYCYYNYQFLAFHTEEQAKLFLKENEDLVKQYLML